MIPNRKINVPQSGLQMVPAGKREWHGFWFLGFFLKLFFFLSFFIFFHQKINWIKLKKRYTGNVNYNLKSIFLDNSSEKLREKNQSLLTEIPFVCEYL